MSGRLALTSLSIPLTIACSSPQFTVPSVINSCSQKREPPPLGQRLRPEPKMEWSKEKAISKRPRPLHLSENSFGRSRQTNPSAFEVFYTATSDRPPKKRPDPVLDQLDSQARPIRNGHVTVPNIQFGRMVHNSKVLGKAIGIELPDVRMLSRTRSSPRH